MDNLNEVLSVNNLKENALWEDHPSHLSMVGGYAISFVLFLGLMFASVQYGLPVYFLAVPVLSVIWCYLVVRCSKYTLSNQRLKFIHGVLNQKEEQMELYRVKDYRLEKPFILRLFGFSNIILDTSDKSCPVFLVYGVSNGEEVIEMIRKNVERRREERFIRELDVN